MNTCPVFIFIQAFSLLVRVVYDRLLLDWNALQVGSVTETKHVLHIQYTYSKGREIIG